MKLASQIRSDLLAVDGLAANVFNLAVRRYFPRVSCDFRGQRPDGLPLYAWPEPHTRRTGRAMSQWLDGDCLIVVFAILNCENLSAHPLLLLFMMQLIRSRYQKELRE